MLDVIMVGRMTLSVISFAYFTHFSNLSPEPIQVFANDKRHFHSCLELYTDTSKKSKGKNLMIVAL